MRGRAHPNERRAAAKTNRVRKPCLALRVQGGKEKKWTDCVESDIWASGLARNWEATALEADVYVEAITESGRRFMSAWRK